MTEQYNNRTKMLRDHAGARDVSYMGREGLTKALEQEHGARVEFKTLATSAGTYGVNGAIIDVAERGTGKHLETLSISGRTLTLLEFV